MDLWISFSRLRNRNHAGLFICFFFFVFVPGAVEDRVPKQLAFALPEYRVSALCKPIETVRFHRKNDGESARVITTRVRKIHPSETNIIPSETRRVTTTSRARELGLTIN